MDSRLLVLAWPSPEFCRHLGSDSVDRRPLSVCFWINKIQNFILKSFLKQNRKEWYIYAYNGICIYIYQYIYEEMVYIWRKREMGTGLSVSRWTERQERSRGGCGLLADAAWGGEASKPPGSVKLNYEFSKLSHAVMTPALGDALGQNLDWEGGEDLNLCIKATDLSSPTAGGNMISWNDLQAPLSSNRLPLMKKIIFLNCKKPDPVWGLDLFPSLCPPPTMMAVSASV